MPLDLGQVLADRRQLIHLAARSEAERGVWMRPFGVRGNEECGWDFALLPNSALCGWDGIFSVCSFLLLARNKQKLLGGFLPSSPSWFAFLYFYFILFTAAFWVVFSNIYSFIFNLNVKFKPLLLGLGFRDGGWLFRGVFRHLIHQVVRCWDNAVCAKCVVFPNQHFLFSFDSSRN